ncbi:DUF6622 family protein [Comamonas flocculans]|uniref:DUF1453 domain-containing protein n=1 Tax=Comamonas flocculans TaxID=2597701 RepID=A0A5B8RTK0_9BURK|nr:DUF6622 family protein [Comamonas flocculans]QEA12054.1 hypothetical protein FOZ74_02810 [Comamonas flocculans]
MLLTQLLSQHPEAITDIVRGTPAWVGALLAGLLWLGFSATREREVAIPRLVLLPLAMTGLALWGVQSAFGASGHLAALLGLWAVCAALVLLAASRLAPPAGTRWNPETRSFTLPGNWVSMVLILVVFLMKYGIGVQLAMEPPLAQHLGFALTVVALYGLLTGFFSARALSVLRLARGGAAALAAPQC